MILICTPELNCLRDVREVQRILGEVIHVDRAKLYLALNYYQPFKVLTREQFEKALEQPVQIELPHAGEAAIKAAMKGQPLVEISGNSAFSKAIDRIVSDIEPAENKAVKGKAARPAAAAASNGKAAQPRGLMRLFHRG